VLSSDGGDGNDQFIERQGYLHLLDRNLHGTKTQDRLEREALERKVEEQEQSEAERKTTKTPRERARTRARTNAAKRASHHPTVVDTEKKHMTTFRLRYDWPCAWLRAAVWL
jgi:hypothetical protein